VRRRTQLQPAICSSSAPQETPTQDSISAPKPILESGREERGRRRKRLDFRRRDRD
jgi:hypothetical protein